MVGKVITFYSYKGGVGRSMAMANVGVLLAKWGYKTLLIDWDLEAPGLENFYEGYLDLPAVREKRGLIDLLNLKLNQSSVDKKSINWDDYISPINIEDNSKLHLITAGRKDESYIGNVRNFDFSTFYTEHDGGEYLESLRQGWIEWYDFVLIDSRTGLTDSSGVCSIQMPDILVLIFTPNEQSFKGILDVSRKAIEGQKKLIFDRFRLRTLPIPSRIEESETNLKDEWLERIAANSESMYDWLPKENPSSDQYAITPAQVINQLKIPYKTLYAYGERLPVVEKGTDDPQSIGYVYETIAAVLANDFQNIHLLKDSRDDYIKKAKGEVVFDYAYYQRKIAEETERLTKQQNEYKQQLEEQFRREQERDRILEEQLKAKEQEELNKKLEEQLKVREEELKKQFDEQLRIKEKEFHARIKAGSESINEEVLYDRTPSTLTDHNATPSNNKILLYSASGFVVIIVTVALLNLCNNNRKSDYESSKSDSSTTAADTATTAYPNNSTYDKMTTTDTFKMMVDTSKKY